MDFQKYLEINARKINSLLAEYLDQEIAESQKVSNELAPLVKTFAKQSMGGKRLRGALVKLGFELAGGEENSEIYKASLAYEIIQTSLLAHDDIIDKSEIRRGNKTMYQDLGGGHYGISQAIILGDVGFFLAFRLIINSGFTDNKKLAALDYFNQSILKTAAGEMLDIQTSFKKRELSEEDALEISHLKTSHYTIIGPLQLGASLAGGDSVLIKNIELFGKNLGVAFQIQDDILGVFGKEEELGKSVTSDIEEGKNTLLIVKAMGKATSEQKKYLDEHYGKGKISEEELREIRQIFMDTGALDYARQKAVKYVNQAKKVVPRLTLEDDKKQLLMELADYLVNRKK
jgi:geranylgeranyl diphosphate synthase, type I